MNKSCIIKTNYLNDYLIKIHMCNIHFREWSNVSQMSHILLSSHFKVFGIFFKNIFRISLFDSVFKTQYV